MTTKLHDWQLRLAEFVLSRKTMPFAWGTNDCATFAADGVQAITGIDPAAHLRGHATAKQAAKTIAKHGDLAGLATAALGAPVPVLMAQIGDVVLVDMGGRDALALCNGSTAMGPGESGLVHVGMDTARQCWRVG